MTDQTAAFRLVIAIARMGEADLAAWWRSHGLDEVGAFMLPDLFPRTALVVGAEIAVLSAAKRHLDALPDRDDVVHLFGDPLPAFSEALAWLAELKTGGDGAFLRELRGWTNVAVAQDAMLRLAGEAPPGERIGNTLRLGKLSIQQLEKSVDAADVAHSLAAAYVTQDRDLAVPYYDVT